MGAVRSSKNGPSRHARRGVTLLEITLAMGLLVVLSSMTYWFYGSALRTSERGVGEATSLRLARVVLDRLATEIRQAAVITADDRVGLRGGPEAKWLSSYRVPGRQQSEERRFRKKPPPGEYDLTKVQYRIVRHPEIEHPDGYEFPLGLARIEVLIPRPDLMALEEALEDEGSRAGKEDDGESVDGSEGDFIEGTSDDEEGLVEGMLEEPFLDEEEERGDISLGPDINWEELYAPEIRYLRLCYFDGSKWWDSWDLTGENPLPQLVLVTIGFEPRPPFGQEFGLEDEVNEEFCECLNEEQLDCEPLAPDQFSIVVRVPQADPLFRSRISRETQSLVEQMSGGQ